MLSEQLRDLSLEVAQCWTALDEESRQKFPAYAAANAVDKPEERVST
jgi:hypothetical protein